MVAMLQQRQPSALAQAQSISIRPADFERLIMPCYLGGGGGGRSAGDNYYQSSYAGQQQRPAVPVNAQFGQSAAGQPLFGGEGGRLSAGAQAAPIYPAPAPQFGPLPGRAPDGGLGGGLGQVLPRASTVDNFVALVAKVEAASPRLAQNMDELIRSLLARFRLDNFYYDLRSRTPISTESSDRRNSDILPAILSPGGPSVDVFGAAAGQGAYGPLEQALDPDEKCSMYFMLSHFVDKTGGTPTLAQMGVAQLAGPLQGQLPPNLQLQAQQSQSQMFMQSQSQTQQTQQTQQQMQSQAGANLASPNLASPNLASSNYPARSAQAAYSAGASGPRFSGPSPSFGSPAAAQMTSFGAGLSSAPTDFAGRNAYGVNSPLPAGPYSSAAGNNPLLSAARLNAGQFGSGSLASNRQALGQPPYVDGQASGRSPDDRLASEFGVVTLAGQQDAALVLNRVLMGILAAATPPQTIRQLAAQVYPNQEALNRNTAKADEELDPLFAVTLADLWAVSSIPKAGRPFDLRLLGLNGRWNDTFCPTSFALERASSIRFTTAELLGGLDGFNLGTLRKHLMSMRKSIKLSELLRIYYSPTGFRPQFAEMGVCNRYALISTRLDELHRQAENYARLLQLNLPTSDNDISLSVNRLEAFREIARQAADKFAPQSICLEGAQGAQFASGPFPPTELYPVGNQDTCEVSRADLVAVLDSSARANGDPFMQLVVFKLAQRLGLAARGGSSLSVMTDQLDTTGTAGGSSSLNTILRNSTNLAELGCALVHDSTTSFQGGQLTDPTRLVELFERALIKLDSEYLTRQAAANGLHQQAASSLSSSSRPTTYVSTWYANGAQFNNPASGYTVGGLGAGPRNTGGAKVILWFNYASRQPRPNQLSSGPTNWRPGQNSLSSLSDRQEENEYRFHEAKRYLKENFRGASILAVSPDREAVKNFVYDQERDIFSDVPAPPGSPALGDGTQNDYALASNAALQMDPSMYSGQADQLVAKLLRRMCTIPALFQYPMCFLGPSDNAQSVGYITPGRKQYWMMTPKTFFASASIRMAFRVEGGRLRVCFGRRPNPDETASRNRDRDQQQQQQQQQAISFASSNNQQSNGGMQQSQVTQSAPVKASGDDYYTGMEYGVCKDVAPGQEIDFLVSDACYKKSISECEPFYFVITEISQPGEGDRNYMCRDDGCKRFDQAKFVMTHTGVVCSSALRAVSLNWFTVIIMTLFTSFAIIGPNNAVPNYAPKSSKQMGRTSASSPASLLLVMASMVAAFMLWPLQQVQAQLQAGVYDFGQGRAGEKRGSFTPSEWVAIILIVMFILGGLAITIALCYYVTRKTRQGTRVPQSDY